MISTVRPPQQGLKYLLIVQILLVCIKSCVSNKCPFYECTPEIASLGHSSLNSTLSIKCAFRKKVEDPSNIMWRFHLGDSERIINPIDGAVLNPFRHEIIQLNNSHHVKTMSILNIHLLNESYYTNYTLMNIGDSCLLTVRVNLQETAMSYTNNAYSFTVRCCQSTSNIILSLLGIYIATKWTCNR